MQKRENQKPLSLDMTSTCHVHLKTGDLKLSQEDNVSLPKTVCELYCDTGF